LNYQHQKNQHFSWVIEFIQNLLHNIRDIVSY
jgi:hypothetical protein